MFFFQWATLKRLGNCTECCFVTILHYRSKPRYGHTPLGPCPLLQIDAGWDSPQISPPLSPHGIVEGTSLSLQSIHDVHGTNGPPLGVLGVGDGVTDDILKEDIENTASFLIDETRDTPDITTASETTRTAG